MKKDRWIYLAFTGVLLIGVAFLLWQEFSFVLGGFGIVLIGFSAMDYIHKK